MTADDRLWLGGWIALCLGIAHDNWTLRALAILCFLVATWRHYREREQP